MLQKCIVSLKKSASAKALSPSAAPPWYDRIAAFPVFLAAFPTLALFSINYYETTWGDAIRCGLVSIAATIIVTLLLSAFFPSRQRAAMASAVIVLLIFTYGPVYSLNPHLARWGSPFLLRDRYLLPAWNITAVLAIWLLFRARLDDLRVTRILNAFSAILCAVACGAILTAAAGGVPTGPAAEATPAEPIVLQTPETKRDIYYLVFDRYADQATLRQDFGYDNQPFIDQLREKGFLVAQHSRANYPKTEISMASALNLTYHGPSLAPMLYYRRMMDEHRVGRLLTEQGYRYYHLGNPLDGLRRNSHASVIYRFSRMPTEFSETVFKMTPFYAYAPATDVRTQELQKLDILKKIPADSEPTLTYAHFLLPHNPWKFDRDGSLLPVSTAAQRSERENYVNQLIYTNSRIVEVVDSILKNSPTPPIIVIQADEGPELRYENDPQKTPLEKIRKRCGIITAAYFPDRQGIELSDTVTPVNTFRLIFNHYFDAELPLLEDRAYYFDPVNPLGKPDWSTPCRFVDVTSQLDGPAEQQATLKGDTQVADMGISTTAQSTP